MAKKSYFDLKAFFIPYDEDHKNVKENQIQPWLLEGRPNQGKHILPDRLDWPCYLGGSSKSHRAN